MVLPIFSLARLFRVCISLSLHSCVFSGAHPPAFVPTIPGLCRAVAF